MTYKEFSLLANLISKSTKVRCIARGINWAASPSQKIIYYPQDTSYLDSDLGYLIHEVGHIRFSKAILGTGKKFENWIYKFGKPAEQIFMLVNSLEDLRIESRMQQVYKGASRYLQISSRESLKRDLQQSIYTKQFDLAGYKKCYGGSWFHYCKYLLWKYALGKKVAQEYLERWNVKDDVKEAINKSQPIIEKVFKCKSTEDIIKLIEKQLIKIYLPLCNDLRLDTRNAIKLLKQLSKIIQEISQERKIKEIKKRKLDGNLTERIKLGREAADNHIRMENISEIFSLPESQEQDITIKELQEATNLYLASARKAISVLKDIEIQRYEGNYESGKLLNRKLYKIKTGQTKIFTRKIGQVKDSKDMVFALLVDESGSMRQKTYYKDASGEKTIMRCHQAAISTAVLGKALEISNKPFGIFGFNELFFIHKKFNERLKLEELVKVTENVLGNGRMETYDARAINRTIELLKQQPQKNKILIVLSDGDSSDNEYNLTEEVTKAEKIARVYGIGIATDKVKNYYPRCVVLEDISLLGQELIKIFKAHIGKRIR